MLKINPVILIILDGWGSSPIEKGNAILQANLPTYSFLVKNFPKANLIASGVEVGLPWGEMGNSEVGHLNIGTGRIVEQDLLRINKAINDGTFFSNNVLLDAVDYLKKKKSTLHLVGLVSNGGVHSHIDHLLALLDFARSQGIGKIAIHAFTDGRDASPKSAQKFIEKIEDKIKEIGVGEIATVIGRYFAMDRDRRWDRTEKAYKALVEGKGIAASSAAAAVEDAYKAGQTDEFIEPRIINPKLTIQEDDLAICFNFRSDRMRQISKSITLKNFEDFKRSKILTSPYFVTFTSYGQESYPNVRITFFSGLIKLCLSHLVSGANLSQLHLAETEKYAHVTYFFNGGKEILHDREEAVLVPSQKVPYYNLKPEMSTPQITDFYLKYFKQKKPDFTVINFANADMVGHTGDFKATIKGLEIIDKSLAKILGLAQDNNASVIITADHGNAEKMIDAETGGIETEHSTAPVPFILAPSAIDTSKISQSVDKQSVIDFHALPPSGILADVAPTILDLLGIEQPPQMTGTSLKNII